MILKSTTINITNTSPYKKLLKKWEEKDLRKLLFLKIIIGKTTAEDFFKPQ